jgi:hypothetical protein
MREGVGAWTLTAWHDNAASIFQMCRNMWFSAATTACHASSTTTIADSIWSSLRG